jgi:Flp pilus assembly secretin CpaC
MQLQRGSPRCVAPTYFFDAAPLLLLLLLVSAAQIGGCPSQKITVLMGHSEVLRFTRPALTVSIADPKIADLNQLPDAEGVKTVLLTGKELGTTNLIAFDADNREIHRVMIEVGNKLIFIKRSERKTWLCNPNCHPPKEDDKLPPQPPTQ